MAAASTAFVPDLLDAAPATLITLDAPVAPNAIEVADLRAATLATVPSTAGPSAETPTGATSAPGLVERSATNGTGANGRAGPRLESDEGVDLPNSTPRAYDLSKPSSDEQHERPDRRVAASIPDSGIGTGRSPLVPPPPLLVSTVGDSSMMFMNAGLAAALGPERWQPVPTEYARWTDGTGGFDRHGCGPTGDSMRIYFSRSVGPLEPRFNHPDDLEHTCDWRRWIPGGLELAESDVVVASWGPTTMWGWERDGQMVDLTDPVIRASVAQAYGDVRDSMIASGVEHLIWVAYPPIVWRPYFDRNREEQPWSRPAVADEFFELLSELGDPVVDLRDMHDPANFGDGLHFTEEASARAAQRILAALPKPVGDP